MENKSLWLIVRDRIYKTNPDWKAAHTYVKEYLSADGKWYTATNSAYKLTHADCKALLPLPHGQYFERAR